MGVHPDTQDGSLESKASLEALGPEGGELQMAASGSVTEHVLSGEVTGRGQ